MSETKDFVWTWDSGETWFSPGLGHSDWHARQYFWTNSQATLLKAIHAESIQGWKPITEVGPAAFKLRYYTVTEHTFNAGNVVLWILTCGIWFFFDLISNFGAYQRARYEPVEFRVTLVR